MPNIASFTSNGTPVPGGGMTLDALMARQKELALRQAAIQGQTSSTIPGGIGQMAGALFTGLAKRKAERQEQEGRASLAQTIAGIDPTTGATPDQWGSAYQHDPQLGLQLMQGAQEAQRYAHEQELALGQRTEDRTWAVEDREDTQAAALQAAEAAATAARAPKLSDKSSMLGHIMQDDSFTNLKNAEPIWASMQDAATRDTPQADLNMVIALAKLFDPDSVVRTEEGVQVRQTGDLPNEIMAQWKYLSANPEGRLGEKIRKGMLDEGYSRLKAYHEAYKGTSAFYTNLAEANGIDPSEIVPQFAPLAPYGQVKDTPEAPQPPAPVPGAGAGAPAAPAPRVVGEPLAPGGAGAPPTVGATRPPPVNPVEELVRKYGSSPVGR